MIINTSDIDFKTVVSIYAAVISTFVFLWRLYEYFEARRARIKIVHNIGQKAVVYNSGAMGDWQQFYVFTVTNLSNNKRSLKKPMFITDRTYNNGRKEFHILDFENKINFPYKLETGDELEYEFPIDPLAETLKGSDVRKFKMVVYDTAGKRYQSKWVHRIK